MKHNKKHQTMKFHMLHIEVSQDVFVLLLLFFIPLTELLPFYLVFCFKYFTTKSKTKCRMHHP